MSLQVKQISKKYAGQYALKNIDFSIENTGVVGVLGPNGAGKSTLMKIIVGAVIPDEGELKINDHQIDFAKAGSASFASYKNSIGYLPEDNPLYLDLYVVEYLKFCADIYQLQNVETTINEVILQTGLQKEQHKKIGQLSKGFRQRVGLAQAILHNPDVLILDEPTTGLDPLQLVEIRRLIQQLGEKKIVILSSHIMQEVEALCDEIIMINKGEIIAKFDTGSWKSIYTEDRSLEELFIRLTEK